MKFLADIEVEEGLKDSDGDLGTGGQVLSSTGTGTNWIDAASGSVGGSITDNQIAVGAATANTIEGSSDFTYTGSIFTVEGRMVLGNDLTIDDPNIFIGLDSGESAVINGQSGALNNIGVGTRALESLTTGNNNTTIGTRAMQESTTVSSCVAVGTNALFYLDGNGNSANYNTAIGAYSGFFHGATTNTTDFVTGGKENIFIGFKSRPLADDPENQIIIGYDAVGGGDDTITLGDSNITTFRIPGLGNTNGHVLTYNTTAGGFILAAGGGGGGIGGSITAAQVAFGATTNDEIDGVSTFTYSDSSGIETLSLGDATSGQQTNFNLSHPNVGGTRARYNLFAGTNLRGYLQSSGTAGEVTLFSNANLVLDCNSTDDITMASSSSSGVGIGTTSPSKKLTVNGTIYTMQASGEVIIAGDSSYASKYITIRDGANYAARWGLQANDGLVTSGVALMSSAKPIAFRASNSIAFASITDSHLIIRPTTFGGVANVGIGTDDPQSKLQVNGGVQIAGDTDSPSADKVGTFRYREVLNIGTPKGSNSYVDMCMRTGDSTYAWVNIVTNNW